MRVRRTHGHGRSHGRGGKTWAEGQQRDRCMTEAKTARQVYEQGVWQAHGQGAWQTHEQAYNRRISKVYDR
eukprot:43834-Eustigmatos_ZCMA.PRE.1